MIYLILKSDESNLCKWSANDFSRKSSQQTAFIWNSVVLEMPTENIQNIQELLWHWAGLTLAKRENARLELSLSYNPDFRIIL